MIVMGRLSTVVCGVVLNDLNLRCNVNSAMLVQKGMQVNVNVVDVIPDCLRIKLSLADNLKDGYSDYSKVL